MIVDGHGLLGRAFASVQDGPEAYVFARGVADSSCVDKDAFAREAATLDLALDEAARLDVVLVYFVGAHIYGRFPTPVNEDTPIVPRTAYGRHQAHAEARIRAHPASHLIVRLPNVVGTGGNRHQLVPALLEQARSGLVHIQAGATRDLIAVADVVAAVDALLRAGVANRTVIVASGISTSARDIVDWLVADAGLAPRIVTVQGGEMQEFRTDLLRSLACDAPTFAADYPRRVIAEFVQAEHHQ